MKNLFWMSAIILLSSLARAEVTCNTLTLDDGLLARSEIERDRKVETYINSKCDTSKPFSVTNLPKTVLYAGGSGATYVTSVEARICCSKP